MPFITQDKTNWKFLLIVIILAVIVGGGILGWQWWLLKQEIKISELELPEKMEELKLSGINFSGKIQFSDIIWQFKKEGQSQSPLGDWYIDGALINRKLERCEVWFGAGEHGICESENCKVINKEEGTMRINEKASVKRTKWAIEEKDREYAFIEYNIKENESWIYNIELYTTQTNLEKCISDFEKVLKTLELEAKVPNWKAYRNEEYGFEIKYPQNWSVTNNIFSSEPNLVFCPPGLTDPNDVCRIKGGATKPQYEGGMIYLFANITDTKPSNPQYHYLGLVNERYYYLFSEGNESVANQMLSTFGFIEARIADWKTYKNEKYRYEIKYPQDWELTGSEEKIYISYPYKVMGIEVRDVTLADFIKEYDKPEIGEKIIKQEDYVLDDIEGVKLTATTGLGVDRNYIFVTKNNKSYIIDFYDSVQFHLNMISTFKFLE